MNYYFSFWFIYSQYGIRNVLYQSDYDSIRFDYRISSMDEVTRNTQLCVRLRDVGHLLHSGERRYAKWTVHLRGCKNGLN